MTKRNEENERMKRKYFYFLRHSSGKNEASIDKIAAAINRFEASTGRKPFKQFHHEQAVAFKARLLREKNLRTGEPLSLATISGIVAVVKAFFKWLADQAGYKRAVTYSEAEFFNLTLKDQSAARAHEERPYPSVDQALHAFRLMPEGNGIELRNKALFAFLLMSGIRLSAIASLKLNHVNREACCVFQSGRDVRTKASKTMTTYLLPIDHEVADCLDRWLDHLESKMLFGPSDPLFPKTRVSRGNSGGFSVTGLERAHWTSAGPIRGIIKSAFEAAGLPQFTPHSFRRTIEQWGAKRCRTPEEFKALSQNLGHESVLTTFASYGTVARDRQGEIIRGMAGDAV